MKRLVLFLLSGSLALAAEITSTSRCHGATAVSRTCSFKNICFKDDAWATFSAGSRPVEVTLGTYDSHNKLVVEDHPDVAVPADADWVEERTFLYFTPSSMYFHWLLDDMLGLWWLLKHHGNFDRSDPHNCRILLSPEQALSSLTRKIPSPFTSHPIQDTNSLAKGRWTCFRRLYAGPSGFNFGGPGIVKVKNTDLFEFRDLFVNRLFPNNSEGILDDFDEKRVRIVLIHRGSSRVILNENELKTRLSNIDTIDLHVLALESLSFPEQLRVLSQTDVLVGMHGSGLANLIFLPQHAGVFEIFPYQFSRGSYEDLAKRFGISYKSWQNDKKENAVFHHEWIQHLPDKEQKEIAASAETRFKTWQANLFWVNQDVRVDVDRVALLISQFAVQVASRKTLKI